MSHVRADDIADEVVLPPSGASTKAKRDRRMLLHRTVLGLAILISWELSARYVIDPFWTSQPTAIFDTLSGWIASGYIFRHLMFTIQEMAIGYFFGAIAGIVVGFTLGLNRYIGNLLDPFVTALYSMPKVALAPLFVLWLGIGIEMKIVLAAVNVFFMVFRNAFAGSRNVDEDLVDVLRVIGASRQDIIKKVILPGSLPWLYVGLKLAVPYGMIGAIFGEILAGNRGIGYVIAYSGGTFDTAGIFSGLLILVTLAMTVSTLLGRSERYFLRWQKVD